MEAQKPKPTAAMAQPRTTARLAPSRSSMRPPICAAMTKPMKKYSRKRPACEAVLCSAIWAYSLAKKKTGMKAIMAINSTRFSTAKGRMRKIATLMSGDSVRSSTRTKTPMMTRPAMMQIQVHGIAPAPEHRLLQAEDAQPDAGRDEHGAPVVDRRPLVLGLRLRHGDQGQRDQGDGDVHPEDGPPRPLGQVAAQDRADGRQPPGDPEEQRQRLAALAQGERVDHDGQGGREHERAAGALDDPERDDPGLGAPTPWASGRTWSTRTDEDDDADHAHLGVAEDVREPSAQGEERGQGRSGSR